MSPELICLTPQHTAYLEQIAKIERGAFSQPLSEAQLRGCAQSPDYRIDAWIADDIVLSYVVMQIVAQEVQILSVASVEKNKGYASALLIRCIQNLHKNELANCIYLEVRCSNTAAKHVYDKLGFICDGIRKNLYDFPKEDGYIMHMEVTESCLYSE